mmetsp:Transcript_29400/g.74162  ORF Transcript_29400/g.74162 Transcript_29400/m.74162 type:complete len:295 (+) Transcript_29400:253-1137(+)
MPRAVLHHDVRSAMRRHAQHGITAPLVLDGCCDELRADREGEAGDDLHGHAHLTACCSLHKRIDDEVHQRRHHYDRDGVGQPEEVPIALEALDREVGAVGACVHLAGLRQEDAPDGALQDVEEEVADEEDGHAVEAHPDASFWKVGVVPMCCYERADASKRHNDGGDLEKSILDECVYEGYRDDHGNKAPTQESQLAHGAAGSGQEGLEHHAQDGFFLLLLHLAVGAPPEHKEQEGQSHEGGSDGPCKEVPILQRNPERWCPGRSPTRKNAVRDRAADVDGQVEVHEEGLFLLL